MKRDDWLMIAIGDEMQPIQLQKTLFKFAMESGVPEEEAYQFGPYNWGPCSFEIYDDLATLTSQGFLEALPSGRGWNSHRLTDKGIGRVSALRSKADKEPYKKLISVRKWVKARGFAKLLQDVYADYPGFATQSLFMD
ncbi:MAG: hypothetical protein ACC700_17280 [Anaerolineales bacterium]